MEPPGDAVRVLRHVHRSTRPGGVVLDLTTVPPAAVIEHAGVGLGSLDQGAFLERAARTEAAVDALIAEGLLAEEASLPHAVLKHFESAGELVADLDERPVSNLPSALRDVLDGVEGPVAERSFCLLRRLRVLPG